MQNTYVIACITLLFWPEHRNDSIRSKREENFSEAYTRLTKHDKRHNFLMICNLGRKIFAHPLTAVVIYYSKEVCRIAVYLHTQINCPFL